MFISQRRTAKPIETLLNSRKYKQHDEPVTLGNVVNRLNSPSEKMSASNVKKAAILESLYQASRHDIVCGEARDSLFDMRSMRKSLQTQLKNDGHKTLYNDGRVQRQLLARKHSGTERCFSAVSSIKLSNASLYSGVVVKRNEEEKKYYTKEASTTMKGDKHNQTESAQSFYSRHMSNVNGDIREDSEIYSKEHFVDLGENKQSCISLEIPSPTTQCEKRKLDLEHHDCSEDDNVFLGVNSWENSDAKSTGEHISSKEKEVLNSLTDPQLKESLQNIIKRRSSVRFVKSDSEYDMVNRDETMNKEVEHTCHEQQQEADIKSVAEEAANSDTNRSIKPATIRQASANQLQRLPSEAASILMCVHSAASSPRSRKIHLGCQEQKMSPARRVSSARSCLSSASQRSLSSPILQRRKSELQTGETRVIRPATAKGYVPNLTNRKVTRKQSAMSSVSCPGISLQKDQAKNLAEVKRIPEFLLMYAKVTTKPKTEDTQKPVRMMSQTPELVIKSAIGQFLTRAFPSGESQEWNGLSATSKKERYEDQQRSKLLRIKICMKHLAAVA